MQDTTGPEMRRRFVWSVALAGLVAGSVALGIALTAGDTVSVTAATHPSTLPPATTKTAAPTTTPTTTTTSTTDPPSAVRVEATPAVTTTTLPVGTLTDGSPAADVSELRRQLNTVTGSALELNGVYDDEARNAVRTFQTLIGVEATGIADPVTRWMLAEAALRAAIPPIGDSCEVAMIGDSLMSGAEELHEAALAGIGCTAEVDGVGGRSLAHGWQCRVARVGHPPQLQLFEKRISGNDTCRPSGLTQLASWAAAGRLGDVVVAALGTNDSGLFDHDRLHRNWAEALRLAGERPVVFLSTQARPGSAQLNRQRTYSDALRAWCASEERCVLADWANTPAAADPASYIDSVHLTESGTRARAQFIADVVAALITGRPIPNPPIPNP